MSKTVHVRHIPDDVYYGLKQWQMRMRTTQWIDFYERVSEVLDRADSALKEHGVPEGVAGIVTQIEQEQGRVGEQPCGKDDRLRRQEYNSGGGQV